MYDDELCGHVTLDGEQWAALAALADRWTLRDGSTGHEQVVGIQEMSIGSVTIALGYCALPGAPTLTITAQELASGEWEFVRT